MKLELNQIRGPQRVDTAEETASIELQRTADALHADLAGVLRPAGLSPTQFNVLHILHAAGPYGLPSREIGDRMITRDPDLTRLLDRLEARGLIDRVRCDKDRRRVYSRETPAGAAVLAGCDPFVRSRIAGVLGHLGPAKLRQLTRLLVEARAVVGAGEASCTGVAPTRGRVDGAG